MDNLFERFFSRMRKTIILFLAVMLVFLPGCTWLSVKEPTGLIAFLWSDQNPPSNGMDLIIADGNGNTLRYVGYFTGSPAFSLNGNLLAIGCRPDSDTEIVSEMCILDISSFISERQLIPLEQAYNTSSAITSKIALPRRCLEYQPDPLGGMEGIFSISWSPRADRLAIVCGDMAVQEVCILPLEGEANCWEQSASDNVFRAIWSPTDENIIAISGWEYPTSKIYLVNPDGTNRRYVVDGMNPEWSPDGKRIAYVEHIINPITGGNGEGIASVDLNGSDHQWLYSPDPAGSNSYIDLGGWDSGWPSRLAWSPDGKYITFSGTYQGWSSFGIFRLEISTGTVVYLVDQGIFDRIVLEPDWGP